MMDNQNTAGTAPETQQEDTFTEEQKERINAIVSKRLNEDRAKRSVEYSKREEELNQREMQIRAKELLSERGLPKSLADVLKYSDEKSLIAAIDVIEHTRGFKDSSAENEQNEQATGKFKYEGFRPIEKGAFHEYDAKDPFREAMGLK